MCQNACFYRIYSFNSWKTSTIKSAHVIYCKAAVDAAPILLLTFGASGGKFSSGDPGSAYTGSVNLCLRSSPVSDVTYCKQIFSMRLMTHHVTPSSIVGVRAHTCTNRRRDKSINQSTNLAIVEACLQCTGPKWLSFPLSASFPWVKLQ